jgi:branched-chain amino acid transport system permease protein
MTEYALHLATLAGIFVIATVALQLLVSQTGLLSVAQAVFMAVGSYSAALLTTRFGAPGILEFFVAAIAALLVSLLISVPSLRLRDDYFAIATFGLQMIAGGVLLNCTTVTNGPMGVADIKPLAAAGISFRSPYTFFILVSACAGLAIWCVELVQASRFGLVLRAIWHDELFAQALGKDTLRFKVKIVGLSAILTAVSGVFYAHFLTYIDPSSFTLMDSVLLLAMVVIGGQSPLGAAAGAIILVLLPEALRFVGLPSALAANLRQVVYGLLLVGVIAFRPQGVFVRSGAASAKGAK